MSVRIRLRRVGRKKQPSYRIVVADARRPRGGEYLDTLGFYNPRRQPAELRLDLEKTEAWLKRGAEPTATAATLIRKARRGGDRTVVLVSVPDAASATAETPRRARAAAGRAARPAAAAAPGPVAAAEGAPAAESPGGAASEAPGAAAAGEPPVAGPEAGEAAEE